MKQPDSIPVEELSEENFEIWFCKDCKLAFKSAEELVQHFVVTRDSVKKVGRWSYEYRGRKYSVLRNLYRDHSLGRRLKKVRCPECGQWGAYGGKSLRCIRCGNRFSRKETAFMDGVYLDEWDVSDRYGKYIQEGTKRVETSFSAEKRGIVVENAKKMVNDLSGTSRSGRRPRIIAASAVYLTSILNGCGRTQKEVASAFNVSASSVGDTHRWMVEELCNEHVESEHTWNELNERYGLKSEA